MIHLSPDESHTTMAALRIALDSYRKDIAIMTREGAKTLEAQFRRQYEDTQNLLIRLESE